MNNVQLIKKMSDTKSLITCNDKYFVISESDRLGYETLVFPSDDEGKIKSWLDVAGGQDMTPDQVIEAMRQNGVRSWDD